MQTKAKHCLVGGIVLLAIVVIFLPLLLHNSRPLTNFKLSMEEPPPPAKPEVQLQLPAVKSSEALPTNTTQSQSAKQAAQQTPVVTQRILNTVPAPAVTPRAASQITKMNEHVDATVKAPKTTTQLSTSDSKYAEKQKAIVATKSKTKPVSRFLLGSSVPKAWVIQVASFSSQANATYLVKQLRAKGFNVYARQNQLDGRMIVRIYVGPEINQNKIKKIQQQLKQQFRLKGVIKRYSA